MIDLLHYSYSYDLTHTLQYNMEPVMQPQYSIPAQDEGNIDSEIPPQDVKDQHVEKQMSGMGDQHVEKQMSGMGKSEQVAMIINIVLFLILYSDLRPLM